MAGAKTLGIISICSAFLIPIAGLTLAIIGLSIKKPKEEKEIATTLNVIGLVASIVAWLLYIVILGRML